MMENDFSKVSSAKISQINYMSDIFYMFTEKITLNLILP